MGKLTDFRIVEVSCQTQRIDYRTPMKFGGRVVQDVTLLHVCADVETVGGARGQGWGSMPLGNVWGWPSQIVPAQETLRAMELLGQRVVQQAAQVDLCGDVLQVVHAVMQPLAEISHQVTAELNCGESMPRLAQLVAASPLDAAIHDAVGRALQRNSFDMLSSELLNDDLATYLGPQFAGEFLDRYTLRQPKPRMPLYHLVGALDPLSPGDVQRPVEDGLPETLADWILADGLTHMKIKLNGDDLPWDVQRVAEIERVAAAAQQQRACSQWSYSLDFNERCPNVEYVLDFLHGLREASPPAWDRVQYIEQPTHRDLKANPENRMHQAAALKPVVIDESLVDLESLLLSREMGYSGVALKACKGHTEALLMGAAAQKYQLFLCVQDLTCPGASFLHSAALSCRIPTVSAIEGNGRQYCPQGNAGWDEAYPEMFVIRDGTLGTHVLNEVGLGFHWPTYPPV